MHEITCLGETNFRHHRRRFGIKRGDRRHHMYIIGKTGTGKSTLIANLARQDVAHNWRCSIRMAISSKRWRARCQRNEDLI